MYKFGKLPQKKDYRTKMFKAYVLKGIASPPVAYNILDIVFENLKTSDVSKLFPMDGNDVLGCCTIAALAHAVTIFNGLVGLTKIMSEEDVTTLYMQLTDGVDSGLNELDVLNYWRKNKVCCTQADQIISYVAIDPKNHTHIKQAITMFGGVYLGFQVQIDAIDDFQNKRLWTPGYSTEEGHAVYAVAYTNDTISVLTWGDLQLGTWEWWDDTVEEAYAILPPEATQPGFATGFDIEQLTEDIALLR